MFLNRVARQADGERGAWAYNRLAGDGATQVADGFANDEPANVTVNVLPSPGPSDGK